ncbi:DUF4079 domain-containing protein [Leptothoe spongobia]|uniref:DUF4079 domain-containing protein n=1 Tax=Leptothoe spongobia TAU-MAC 1115 TaxID=1967444 RepID=A0A947GK69_9CYAN|nr:DUF4079 domain-containing protein [Leptothoe spongobia]MBT9317079.1 DUF4079 domain-containing protein [Leptothoe spongobia TAU-MAC 1115]
MSPETIEVIKPYLNFIHPVMMWVLFGLMIYAMHLGIQSRKVRYASGQEKKALIKGKFTLKHHQLGSIILALMVLGTIGAMAVTYINNAKLFMGPHLLAGLGMTGLIAIAAALVPFMQRGSETARLAHISLNVVLVGLFGWQAITGMQIMQRILEKSFGIVF